MASAVRSFWQQKCCKSDADKRSNGLITIFGFLTTQISYNLETVCPNIAAIISCLYTLNKPSLECHTYIQNRFGEARRRRKPKLDGEKISITQSSTEKKTHFLCEILARMNRWTIFLGYLSIYLNSCQR